MKSHIKDSVKKSSTEAHFHTLLRQSGESIHISCFGIHYSDAKVGRSQCFISALRSGDHLEADF